LKKVAKAPAKKNTGDLDPSFMPVVAAFADDPYVSREKMFGSGSVLSVKGKVFAMLSRARIARRVGSARAAKVESSNPILNGRGHNI
jgi:hypothetical protein